MTVKGSKEKTSRPGCNARVSCRRLGSESVRKIAAAERIARNALIRFPLIEEAIKFEKPMDMKPLIKGGLTE